MVIDTSAIVAMLLDEPESALFVQIVAADPPLAMSAITFHETSIVIAGKVGQEGVRWFDDLVRDAAITVFAVTPEDAVAAREAYFRYGRGYHPAGLNLADCFAYTLAKARNEPLLFKGDDFAKTDVVPAWRPQT